MVGGGVAHLLAVEVGEPAQRYSIGDAFAQLAIIPVLQAHQNQCAQHLRRREATAALARLFQAAHQVAAHSLDQRRLTIEKITDHPQRRLKPNALPQQLASPQEHELWLTLRSAPSGISSLPSGKAGGSEWDWSSRQHTRGCNCSPFSTP
jgi:hypothetical protein